jgi:hypothetical protein
MVHQPAVTEYIKNAAHRMDVASDAVDDVNKLKYDDASNFDAEKDKAAFRQYEDACDRVKNFYAVCPLLFDIFFTIANDIGTTSKTDFTI